MTGSAKIPWSVRMQQRLDAAAQFTIDVIYDRRDGRKERVVGAMLFGLSLIFRSLVGLRTLLYRHRILRNHHLGCLVIVVGNLTVGGTGKTPVVERLARVLNERGRKVAILSRGYKSTRESMFKRWWRALSHGEPPPPKVVSNGEEVLVGPHEAGDEPYMLARNLPGVVVIVDKDRVKAGSYAIRNFGADTLILDDGFQYFALKDHLQVLLIDKTNPFGNRRLLPRGILREPVSHLRRASYIFYTKSNGTANEELDALVERYRPGSEVIECTHMPQFLQRVDGAEQEPLESLEGQKVAVFSGIAMPESFEIFFARFGAEIVVQRRFLDHHWYHPGELEDIFARAAEAGADRVVTTEKDAARLDPDKQWPLPFFYLRVQIKIISGADDFEEAVSRICFPKNAIRSTRPSRMIDRLD